MKILNFGSLNLDYVYSVDHFVKPGETLITDSYQVLPGGKGLNQSVSIARAGVSVYHAGKVGKGSDMLLDVLTKSGVNTELVQKTDQVTGHTIIQVDRTGQNCILECCGENGNIDIHFIDEVISQFHKGDILLIQNEINNLPYIMQRAYQSGLRIALNPSPVNRQILECPLEYVTWFILNEIEGKGLTEKESPEDITDTLLRRYPNSAVVLTLGKKGVYYKDKNQIMTHGIYKVNRVDTTGAGDTFTGYFISGVVENLKIEEILRRASVASSLAVSRQGAANSIPYLTEVLGSSLVLES